MALIDAGMVIAIKDLSLCSINDSKAMQAFLPKEDTDRTLAHQPLAEYPFCATEIWWRPAPPNFFSVTGVLEHDLQHEILIAP